LMERERLFLEIAKYLPNEVRRELVQRLFEVNEHSICATSKDMQTSRVQLYRYLGLTKRRNYPSDEVTMRALKALYQKRPAELTYLLQQQLERMKRLVEALYV
jgi:hypothetical protein